VGRHRIRRRHARLCEFRFAGLPAGGALLFDLVLRDDIAINIIRQVKLMQRSAEELLTGYGESDIILTDGWDALVSASLMKRCAFQRS